MSEQVDRTVQTRTPPPPVGPAGSSQTRTDGVASAFATLAAEAQAAALGYRASERAAIVPQMKAETPKRRRQAQHGGGT